MKDVVEQVEEVTLWRTTDGKTFETSDEAYDHQEQVNFRKWLSYNYGEGYDIIVDAILRSWRVIPR